MIQGFQLTAGVGPQNGATIPVFGGSNPAIQTSDNSSETTPATPKQFFGEPFAVWLGFILLLVILKFLTEEPGYKILGADVNPAHIRIGGYNWMIIGVSATTFIVIMKVIFNRFNVPGLTAYTNAF